MKKTLQEKAEQKLKNLKALKEQLNVQLHLNADDTKVEFEKQKKNLSEWLDSTNKKLQNVKGISEEKTQKINSSIAALSSQAALGMAKTDDVLSEQQKKISDSIKTLQMDVNEAFNASKDEVKDIGEEVDYKLSDFHSRFDLFRLQFHLGKLESKDAWEQKKKLISADLHDIEAKIDKGFAGASEKWDYFSDEVSDSWKRLVNVFKS